MQRKRVSFAAALVALVGGLVVAPPVHADGRLYVFGSKANVPVFREQTASVIEKATENWAKLRDSP